MAGETGTPRHGAKTGLEYEARNVKLKNNECWGAVAEAINDMATDGWALASVSHPEPKQALLVFSRPMTAARTAARVKAKAAAAVEFALAAAGQ